MYYIQVTLQGSVGDPDAGFYSDQCELEELEALLSQLEIKAAGELSAIGNKSWAKLELVSVQFWACPEDILLDNGGKEVRYNKKGKMLEVDLGIDKTKFKSMTTGQRAIYLFSNALICTMEGFEDNKKDIRELTQLAGIMDIPVTREVCAVVGGVSESENSRRDGARINVLKDGHSCVFLYKGSVSSLEFVSMGVRYYDDVETGFCYSVVVYEGRLGRVGSYTEIVCLNKRMARERVKDKIREAEGLGYQNPDPKNRRALSVEFQTKGAWEGFVFEDREELEGMISAALLEFGLGCVDGGTVGNGMVEYTCHVTNCELSERVLENRIMKSRFVDVGRAYDY